MNGIPLTFNEHHLKRTIIGGQISESSPKMDVSVILLNETGPQFHTPIIENLLACGFKSIISVEPDNTSYNLENIARKYPTVKFLIPMEQTTSGELINACMEDVNSSYVLVLRDTLYIPSGFFLENMAENLIKENVFCLVPRLSARDRSSVAMHVIPKAQKGHFMLESVSSVQDMVPTVFPYDYIGLYNREKFIQLGGFDYTITSTYWQLADLSMRAWLWGEKIKITTRLTLSYREELNVPDTTANLSSLRFYLKNVLPRFKNGKAVITKFSFFLFLRHSSCGFFESLRQFKDARKWVEQNKFRFVQGVEEFIEGWKY